MTKTYTGVRWIEKVIVQVDEQDLPPREDLKKLSDNGFEWGYEGEEPAQLALAILADHLQDDARALHYYDLYMREAVSYFENDWTTTSDDIERALAQYADHEP